MTYVLGCLTPPKNTPLGAGSIKVIDGVYYQCRVAGNTLEYGMIAGDARIISSCDV